MAGVAIHFDLQGLKAVQARLDRLGELGATELRPLLEEIGETVASQTKQRFDDQTAPDGTAWAPSQRATDDDGQILVDKGILKNAIGYQVGSGQVQIGTNVVYGAVHQLGSADEPVKVPAHQRRITQAFGRELRFPVWVDVGAYSFVQNIPARPYLGLSDADEAEIGQVVDDFIREVLK